MIPSFMSKEEFKLREIASIKAAIEKTSNVTEAAKILGLKRTTLTMKMRSYGIKSRLKAYKEGS